MSASEKSTADAQDKAELLARLTASVERDRRARLESGLNSDDSSEDLEGEEDDDEETLDTGRVTKDCKAELRETIAQINAGNHSSTLRTSQWLKAKHPEDLGASHTVLAQNLAVNQMSLDRIEAKVDALMEYLVDTSGISDESSAEDTKKVKRKRENEEDDEEGKTARTQKMVMNVATR